VNSPDVLKYGAIGLALLLAGFSFLLLQKEQARKGDPRPSMLRWIGAFMALTVIFVIAAFYLEGLKAQIDPVRANLGATSAEYADTVRGKWRFEDFRDIDWPEVKYTGIHIYKRELNFNPQGTTVQVRGQIDVFALSGEQLNSGIAFIGSALISANYLAGSYTLGPTAGPRGFGTFFFRFDHDGTTGTIDFIFRPVAKDVPVGRARGILKNVNHDQQAL
jgi:hypothetical protein